MSQEDANAQLLTSSCTSGWSDWLWGELWLLPDGLLRLSTGWRGLIAALTFGMIGAASSGSVRRIEPEEIRDLLDKWGRNRWIPRDRITHAALKTGLMNGRLAVSLADGTRVKLLWIKDVTVHQVLRSTVRRSADVGMRAPLEAAGLRE